MTVRGIVARRVMLGVGLTLTLAAALCWPAAMQASRREAHPLSLQHPHQREPDRHLQDGRPLRRGRPEAAQPFHARLAAQRIARDGSRADRPDLDAARGARIERAGQAHLGLPFGDDQQQAPAQGRRPGQEQPAHPRQGSRHPVPRRAGEDAAQLGADSGMGRRRLLPDLWRPLRACRHRPRAHVAAHRPPRARGTLPQGADQISAARRQADHPARL